MHVLILKQKMIYYKTFLKKGLKSIETNKIDKNRKVSVDIELQSC